MDNLRIAFLALLILISVHGVTAMTTEGTCSGEVVTIYGTCTATGFRLSDSQTNVTFKVEDVDTSAPPYQAEIRISAFWDTYGSYGYDEVVQVGTHTYTNPSDSNDFVRFQITAIGGGGDSRYVEFGEIDYQKTSYVGSGGSDSNSGKDTSNKWATFTHAVSTLLAGEDVIVSNGSYNNLNGIVPNSGAIGAPIIYRGDGTYPLLTGHIAFNGRHYINLSGFQLYGDSYGAFDFGNSASFINIYDNHISSSVGIDINPYYTSADCNIFDNVFADKVSFQQTGGSNMVFTNNTMLLNNAHVLYYSTSIWNINGNYWAAYTGIDENGDKVGDTSFTQSGSSDHDAYPKMDRESGWIRYPDSFFVSNATVYQLGSEYRNTTTDANGHYALSTIGRDAITLFAIKNSSYGNGTFNYDDTQANFTINASDYNNTNTIIFSSDINPDNVISAVEYNTQFYINTYINNSNYDPDHDYYTLRIIYKPDGTIINDSIPLDQYTQIPFIFNNNYSSGTYTFQIRSYYWGVAYAEAELGLNNEDMASMYFSSDTDGLYHISSAFFNHTVYLQISHQFGNFTGYSYNISFLKPNNDTFYNMSNYLGEYGTASWYTPSIATGTWTVKFIKKNLGNSSEETLNTTTIYLSAEAVPPAVNYSTVSGFVRESVGLNPLYLASITFSGAHSYVTSTNAMGYYSVTNVQDGNYTVTASKTGYNSVSHGITVLNSSISNLNFVLTCTGSCETPTPTPTPTGTPAPTVTNPIQPGSVTESDLGTLFWDCLFIGVIIFVIGFFWTIGDRR